MSETKALENVLIGYGKADITPTESVPLAGFGNTSARMSTGHRERMYIITLAARDAEGETVLLMSADMTAIYTEHCDIIRDRISQKLHVPVKNIVISSIHQHSCPDLENTDEPSITRYFEFLTNACLQSARDAINDLAPAQMYTTRVATQNMTFVRHYLMNDGTYAGDNFGNHKSGYAAHETEADNIIQLVKFVRAGEGKNIILTNFQGHPHRGTNNYLDAHSDLVGVYREETEKALGCNVIYFSGASGNLNMISNIKEENIHEDYIAHGKALAAYVIGAEGTYQKANAQKVGAVQETIVCKTNHAFDEFYEQSLEIVKFWRESGNKKEARLRARALGLSSEYHCTAIIARHSMPDTKDLLVNALHIGDVGFASAAGEMFDTNGMEIKESAKFPMTCILYQCNGAEGYLPSKLNYEHGGYAASTTRYAEGIGETVSEYLTRMLNQLYNDK